jgi:hypothetical protein
LTDEQQAALRTASASLRNIGGALAEAFKHAGDQRSTTPLLPLDECLRTELPNLRRNGWNELADFLVDFRASYGD